MQLKSGFDIGDCSSSIGTICGVETNNSWCNCLLQILSYVLAWNSLMVPHNNYKKINQQPLQLPTILHIIVGQSSVVCAFGCHQCTLSLKYRTKEKKRSFFTQIVVVWKHIVKCQIVAHRTKVMDEDEVLGPNISNPRQLWLLIPFSPMMLPWILVTYQGNKQVFHNHVVHIGSPPFWCMPHSTQDSQCQDTL